MKKITAILLVLVLVFSISATALAATETKVTVTVTATQISVTVPMSITIAAKVDGGSAGVPDNYKFTNNSYIPVKVDTIAVAFKEGTTNWVFAAEPKVEGTNPADPVKNELYLKINDQVMEVQTASAPSAPSSWNITANDGTTPGTLALPIVASTSRLNTTEHATDLITITYVVSACTAN